MLARHAIVVAILGGFLGLLPFDSALAATPTQALETKGSCLFEKTPLKDITDYFSKVHQVPMKLDAGVDGTSFVTLKHTGTLKEILEKMLPSLGLEYVADAKEIVIRKKK